MPPQKMTQLRGSQKNPLIHLEPAVAQFIAQIANNKHKSMDEIVNAWLKKDIQWVESVS